MSTEIERKFLVSRTDMLVGLRGVQLRQWYLARGAVTVRVRVSDDAAWLTVKGPTRGIARAEFEYAIPLSDATELEHLADGAPIVKTRYAIPLGTHIYEVDVFHGANSPLIVAEIELRSADEDFKKPDWLGAEVSADARYKNSYLAAHPYSTW